MSEPECKTLKQPCPTRCTSVKPDRCRAKPKEGKGYVGPAAKPAASPKAAAPKARAANVARPSKLSLENSAAAYEKRAIAARRFKIDDSESDAQANAVSRFAAKPKQLPFLHISKNKEGMNTSSYCQQLSKEDCGVGASKTVCGWVGNYERTKDGKEVEVSGSCRRGVDRQTHNGVKVKTDMYAHLAAVNAGRNAADKALRTSFTPDEYAGFRIKYASKIGDLAEDEDEIPEVEEEVVAELKRAKSSHLVEDPAVQTYVELRSKLTKDDGAVLNEVMTRMHAEVDRITSSGLDSKAEKEALDTLFGKGAKGKEVDLCKFVKGAKGQVTVDELKGIMAILSEKTKVDIPTKVSSTKLRGSMCYIVLSVLMMTPDEFVKRFTGLNKSK